MAFLFEVPMVVHFGVSESNSEFYTVNIKNTESQKDRYLAAMVSFFESR
jgi:hypothetical protein